MSLDDCSVGLFISVECIPVVRHHKDFRNLLLSLHEMHFILSCMARQLSLHSVPKDKSSGPELSWQV